MNDDRPVHVVVDTSAILSFVRGQCVAVGELIREVAAAGGVVAIPARCAFQALITADREGRDITDDIEFLCTHPDVLLVWRRSDDHPVRVLWERFYRHEDLAAVRTEADRLGVHILTAEPDAYAIDGKVPADVIGIGDDFE